MKALVRMRSLCIFPFAFLIGLESLRIKQPPAHESSIALVGAGPASIHIASRLKKRGYSNIVLFERTKRIGGKSLTLYRNQDGPCEQGADTSTCVAYEMGTCFLHNGYHNVRALAQEYGMQDFIAPEGRAVFSNVSE